MIEKIDEAMLAIQGGVFALEHYGAEHPAVNKAFERACGLLSEAMEKSDSVCVMAAAEHVVAMGKALPSSTSLFEGLFSRLGHHGVTSLSFMRGITPQELSSMAAWACAQHPDWQGSAHLHPGSVESSGGEGPSGAGPGEPHGGSVRGSGTPLDPAHQAGAVREVLTSVSSGEWSDQDGVQCLVSAISDAVTESSGMIIPLACLKRHDEYTFVHTTNVAILSASLGEAVGLGTGQILDLTMAAILHDVGKRGVPRAVLNKPGKLTDRELKMMRQHPTDGARILFGAGTVPDIVPIVAFEHHIHLDGSGYPDVRPGWRVSLASQIVQVADVYDALRTNRPYRKAMSQQEAFDLMMRDAGVRFDRNLLELFFERVAKRTDREALPELWTPTQRAA